MPALSSHREPAKMPSNSIRILPLCRKDQAPARRLILSGLAERWGHLDPTKNPDLDDIATVYAGTTFLLAWDGDELVGTGALIHEVAGAARIVRMSVAAARRRQGIGSLILRHLLAAARAAGYRQVTLETTSTWHDAIAFYQRHGFREIGAWDGDTHLLLDLGEDG